MKILAVEGATGPCSVAIRVDGNPIAELSESENSQQAERLIPMITSTLEQADVTFDDLDALACTVGPGSFTGVRIGIAALNGIKIATKLPTIGVNTMEALAWQARDDKDIIAVLNARRDEIYMQHFQSDDDLTPITAPELIPLDAFSNYLPNHPVTIASNCLDLLTDKTLGQHTLTESLIPHARDVAALVEQRYKNNIAGEKLTPLYIRPPDAKLPKQ